MRKSDPDLQTPNAENSESLEDIKAQMTEVQMEIDILKETINILKNDSGINQTALKSREKVVIIDTLKVKYSLPVWGILPTDITEFAI